MALISVKKLNTGPNKTRLIENQPVLFSAKCVIKGRVTRRPTNIEKVNNSSNINKSNEQIIHSLVDNWIRVTTTATYPRTPLTNKPFSHLPSIRTLPGLID